MKKSFMEWLTNWLNPCVHQWQVIEKLKDNEDAPSIVTLVRECSVCGMVDTVEIKGPKRGCPPHQWKPTETIRVWPSGRKADTPGVVPEAVIKVYACERCGETMSKRLTADGFEEKKRKRA